MNNREVLNVSGLGCNEAMVLGFKCDLWGNFVSKVWLFPTSTHVG